MIHRITSYTQSLRGKVVTVQDLHLLPKRTINREKRQLRNLATDVGSNVLVPQPFLKWAGGKRGLLNEIRLRTPSFSGRYFEPFVGAGAVLFDQDPLREKVVSDTNAHLIEAYEVIRDTPEELISELRKHVNSESHYYTVRAWDRTPDFKLRTPVERAARFIYLNKTTFNGLYRVNAAGQMNVPFGGQTTADWVQEKTVFAVHNFLKMRSKAGNHLTQLSCEDYKASLAKTNPGDWVYLDPPYAPVSPTSSFTAYSQNGFSAQDQVELRDELIALTQRGVAFLLSNSDVPLIHELYSSADIFKIESVTVRRVISARSKGRGQISEVMISNYHSLGN